MRNHLYIAGAPSSNREIHLWGWWSRISPALLDTEVLGGGVEVQDAVLRLLDEPHEFLGEEP
jgi:hypothetical protein